jgi:predicted RNA-binding Zn ribbon-like protein
LRVTCQLVYSGYRPEMQIVDSPATTLAMPLGHAHTADLDACLDLINSEEFDGAWREPKEHLPTVDDAIAYFTTRGLAHEASIRAQAESGPGGGDAWLQRLYATRAALREVWDAQVEARTPATGALDAVNALLREAPRVELVPGAGGVGVGHRHTEDDPTGEALARVIEPLVEALAGGDTGRFRICANDGCRWVFEDTSRAGRRRWCDMSSCGNQAKVRRYRSKQKASDPVEPGTTGADA